MPDHPEPPDRPVPPPLREAVQRWRLVAAREPLAPGSGQREQLAAWDAALARSGLPVAGLDADPPRPRYALAAPLAAAIRAEAELVDVWLIERTPAWRVRVSLGASLPPGYALVEAYDVWLGAPPLPGQVIASVYRSSLPSDAGPEVLAAAAAAMLAADSLPRERTKGQGVVSYDLRPFLLELEVGAAIRMTLRHDPERGIGRPEEVLAELGGRIGVTLEARDVVRERLVLAPPPEPAPPAPRARSRRPPMGPGQGRR